jgi:hypothetical protein
MHNLNEMRVSGTEDLEQKFLILGEGVALMLEYSDELKGEITVSFMRGGVVTTYKLTRPSSDTIKVTKVK